MKILVCTMAFLFSFTLTAQSDSTSANNPDEIILTNALQFQMSSNFTLSSFQGSVISYKRNFSKSSAIRIGLSLSTNLQRDEDYNRVTPPDSTISSDVRKTDVNSILLRCQYIKQSPRKFNTSMFLGAGPVLGYGYDRRKSDIMIQGMTQTDNRETNTWTFGISFILGAEWFFRKNMSLLGEYGLNVLYEWENTTRTQRAIAILGEEKTRTIENKRNIFRVGASSVKFGLSVYF